MKVGDLVTCTMNSLANPIKIGIIVMTVPSEAGSIKPYPYVGVIFSDEYDAVHIRHLEVINESR